MVGTVTPTISVRPVVANGALSFGRSQINGAGDSLGLVSGVLSKVFAVSIPLDGLPFQVQVRSLTVDRSGLHAGFVGADLTYRKGS